MTSSFYSEHHRALQDRFETSGLADMMEHAIVHTAFTDEDRTFIETRDLLFLATVDAGGRPTVSYKGGGPGFVRITGPSTLTFPCYDGNGMFYSMGNILQTPSVGLLFIDFERPHRLRAQGTASLSFDDPALADYPEAQFMAQVSVEHIWVNCPRYIHTYRRTGASRYVPKDGRETPVPGWKRLDVVQPALSASDRAKAEAQSGVISQEEYARLVAAGEG